MECPVCKKEFDEYTGRKPKKFCSDVCKVKFWNSMKKVKENNKPENKKRILGERSTVVVKDFKQPEPPDTTKQEQIKELEEKIRLLPQGQYYNKMVKIYQDKINQLKA